MSSSLRTAAAVTLAFGALATASSVSKVKQMISPYVGHPDVNVNIIEEIYRPWAKYGRELSVAQKAAKAKASEGSVVASPLFGGSQYVIPVAIGHPARTLYLDLDTGSSDLWVMSNWTDPEELAYNNTLWTPGPSSKLLEGYNFSVSYGDGSFATGIVYDDIVNISGVVAPNQAVEAAEQIGLAFSINPYVDGLIGVASKTLNQVYPVQQNTFFDNVKAALKQPLFAANLHVSSPGEYDFGYIDHSSYTGNITWTDIVGSTGWWQISIGKYAVSNNTGKYGDIGLGIVDTGTSLTYVPQNITGDYYSYVPGSSYDSQYGIYVFPCNETLPDFTLHVERVPLTLKGFTQNFGPLETGGSQCVGGIQSNSGLGITILGDSFIQSFYVIFKDASVGFANKPYTP